MSLSEGGSRAAVEPERAVSEMRRVTRPGGVVAAAVWDAEGGAVMQRMFWDTAAARRRIGRERRESPSAPP